MENELIQQRFSPLSTALIADACVRNDLPLRLAPAGINPVLLGMRLAGHALPARHYGSVDIFLEAMTRASSGDVLVIDNGGRTDEGCIGDLTALEARASGLAGMVVWGFHRDTSELKELAFPVFSYGACPAGPLRSDPREGDALNYARLGPTVVEPGDVVFADDDGALVVAGLSVDVVLASAEEISATERRQAGQVNAGETLREQLAFADYLEKREADPTYTLRQHLREIGGAIEE